MMGKLVVKYVPTFTKGTLLKKRSVKDLSNDACVIFFFFFCVCVFLILFIKALWCGYTFEWHQQVNAIQMGAPNICLYKEVDKKYTGCNLKTMELLDCALIGVWTVRLLGYVW